MERGATGSPRKETIGECNQESEDMVSRRREAEYALSWEQEVDGVSHNFREAVTVTRRERNAEAALVREEEKAKRQVVEAITLRGKKAEAALRREEEATRRQQAKAGVGPEIKSWWNESRTQSQENEVGIL